MAPFSEDLARARFQILAAIIADPDPGRFLSAEERARYEAANRSIVEARNHVHVCRRGDLNLLADHDRRAVAEAKDYVMVCAHDDVRASLIAAGTVMEAPCLGT